VSVPAAEALTRLLAAYADPDPEQAMRLLDVPLDLGARCLRYLPPDLAGARWTIGDVRDGR
jgi:hypothetical protein